MDITSHFNELLRERNAPTTKSDMNLDRIDGFLKDALRINSHIAQLHHKLRSLRRQYLSRTQPRKGYHQDTSGQPAALSDRDKEELDRNAKEMLRELNWSIETLDGAEAVRYETEIKSIEKKHGSNLGALGAWASGGAVSGKTPEQLAAEAQAREVKNHRDGVLWYLRQKLQQCGQTQKTMMEARLARELEMNQSLASQAPNLADFAKFTPAGGRGDNTAGAGAATQASSADENAASNEGLSEEQLQMFEQGNQDMMQYFESMHEKVQTAQKSLAEISDLQTTLISHLATQTEHIDQLVGDSFSTTENVEGGNKQLKKATERPSTARLTFYAASCLCTFLVLWDIII